MSIKQNVFGKTKNNETVYLYELYNSYIKIEILSYGGIIRKLETPDKNGIFETIVLGYETLKEYEDNPAYLGCITGRIAGRTKNGILNINGTIYELEKNNGSNNLHGGINSLNKKNWSSSTTENENESILTLEYTSPHLENFFPGTINFKVKYILEDNSLTIVYEGISDQPTFINLTNHSYFNLSGNFKRDISKQKITLSAEKYLEIAEDSLPTKFSTVTDTPFDLREFKTFENAINSAHPQILAANHGFDHAFSLNLEKHHCKIIDEISGRVLEMTTDQPSVVIYTGNFLDGAGTLLNGVNLKNHLGFCLETQNYPDVFNVAPSFAKIFDSNNIYTQKTTFTFSIL